MYVTSKVLSILTSYMIWLWLRWSVCWFSSTHIFQDIWKHFYYCNCHRPFSSQICLNICSANQILIYLNRWVLYITFRWLLTISYIFICLVSGDSFFSMFLSTDKATVKDTCTRMVLMRLSNFLIISKVELFGK